MFNQFVKNVSSATSIVPDLSSVIDGSFKLRLRNMRLRKGSQSKVVVTHDNQVLFKMHSTFNFSRIKYADQIGVSYWASAKYDPSRTMAPVSYYTLLDGAQKPLHHQAAILDGTLEGPQTAWSQEIDNLHNFVASSSKQRIVSQYVTLPGGAVKEVSQFPKTSKFEMPDENSWQDDHGVRHYFSNASIEEEWKQVVAEETATTTKQKKSRTKKSKRNTLSAQSGSADLVDVAATASRRNRKRVTSTKQLVTA